MPSKRVQCAAAGLGRGKSIAILLVVIICLLILWPKVFFPMLKIGLRKVIGTKGDNFEEDMKLSPLMRRSMKANAKAKTQQGDPRMRAHLGGAPQNASSGSMFNLLIPVYIILMGSFFLYVVINLFIGRKEPTTIKKKKCVECCRYKRSQSTTTTTTQGPGPSKRSKPSNIYETLPTYRAISQHGNDNVRQTLQSLVKDMQTLRTHLVKAEACRCKLRKYKLAQTAAMQCMEQMQGDKEKDDEAKIIETNEANEAVLLEGTSNQNMEPETKVTEEIIAEADKVEEIIAEAEDKVEDITEDDLKENEPPSLVTNKKNKKKTKMSKLKQRLNVVKYLRQHSNMELYEDDDHVGIEMDNAKKMMWSKDTLNKFNREFERLVGLEKLKKFKTKKDKTD